MRSEKLTTAILEKGKTIPGDRAFAFQFLDDKVPEALRLVAADQAPWIFKAHLAVQHDWPDMALIMAKWNDSKQSLTLAVDDKNNTKFIEASVIGTEGRQSLANFMSEFLKTKVPYAKARHPELSPLRLVGNANLNSHYPDGEKGLVSIALTESIIDLENQFQFDVDKRRFRMNLLLQGGTAWDEIKWAGKKIRIGSTVFEVVKPIGRCPNIDVNQDTGVREKEIFPRMKEVLGHSIFGVRANVSKSGEIKEGDSWEVLK